MRKIKFRAWDKINKRWCGKMINGTFVKQEDL